MNDNWVSDPNALTPDAITTRLNGDGVFIDFATILHLASIVDIAAHLEAFLGKCAGTTAEYPVDIICRDEVAAELLTSLLRELHWRLSNAGLHLKFDASDMPPPPKSNRAT